MSDTWALVSDIHGNLRALERVMECARSEGAEKLAFLGDALGSPDDEACCRLLMEHADLAVFGNRELRVRLALPDDVQGWLRSLPATAVLDDALLCHSSPASAFPADITAAVAITSRRGISYWSQFPYISGRASVLDAARELTHMELSAMFHGHTHRQVAWKIRGGVPERVRERELVVGDETTLVGIGAVGEGEEGCIEFCLYFPADRRVRLVSLKGE